MSLKRLLPLLCAISTAAPEVFLVLGLLIYGAVS
jgi:hypothetical protein